jgi:hypothetical protein
MVHRFIILLLLLGAWGVALSAQSAPEVSDPTLLALDLPEVVDGSLAHLRQIGDFNEILVEQVNQQALVARQKGNHNYLSAMLEGESNLVLVDQVGHGNTYILNLEGLDNQFTIGQYGNENTLIQDLQRTDALHMTIEQHGDGNRLEHIESDFGSLGVPVDIRQSGGMSLKITNLADYIGG